MKQQTSCKFFAKSGSCNNGADCRFLHNLELGSSNTPLSDNEPFNVVGRTSVKLGPGLEVQEVVMDAASFPVTIYNLPTALSNNPEAILEMFQTFGVAQKVKVLDGKVIVNLSSEPAAEAAVRALNNTLADAISQQPLRLTYKKSQGSKILDSAYKIEWYRPRWDPDDMRETVRRKLAEFGELKSFKVKRLAFGSAKDKALVIFANRQSASRAYQQLHDTDIPYIDTPLYFEPLLSYSMLILRTVWGHIENVLQDSIFDEVSTDIEERENSPLILLKLKSNDSKLLVRAIHRINTRLAGKVLFANGKVLWDPVFATKEWTAQLNMLGKAFDNSLIYRDSRKKQLILYGKADEHLISFEIQKALEEHQKNRDLYKFQLTKDSMRRFLKFGPQKLKGLAGAKELKVDVLKCSVSIEGPQNATLFFNNWLNNPEDSEEKLAAISSSDEFFCAVCITECPAEEGRSMPACMHVFCQDCLKALLSHASTSGPFPICCVAEKCTEKLDLSLIQSFSSLAEFQALVNASFNSFVNSNGNKFQFCPTPDCPQIYAVDTGTTECDTCNASICANCRTISHEGLSCEEFQKVKDDPNELAFLSWKKTNANVKDCPKCSTVLEKNGGCNHMTCSKCRSHICWVCMGVFASDTIYEHMRKAHGSIYDHEI
ncbi:hypothetical protein HDU97_009587 [Phlyctochytrium planicorne]|nr:hypothetical protein HDU97_009587 [Phlyctochytrium planicorne]